MIIEWDAVKARKNLAKHDVSFDEASTVFGDPLALTIPDPVHSDQEERFVTLGVTSNFKTVVVAHVDRGEKIRIISARDATWSERRDYEEGIKS
jgi:uncharacterized DUF497 family protein